MRYTYPCNIEGNEKDGEGFVATFPDLEGAVTGGFTFKEAIIMAEDCLVVSLASYVDRQKELPAPSGWEKGQELLTVQPLIAAQLDLYRAMRERNISTSDLAEGQNQPESVVNRLLSMDYKTSINEVMEALELLGCKPASQDLAA